MKVAVVGGGGREHAIIKKLRENPRITQLYALPGNGGIGCDAECVPVKATDLDGIEEFVRTHGIEFVVVAPDDPLVMGLVDRLNGIGVPCFGPDAKAAIIEGSKAFSKQLMKKYNIPTARYEIFTDAEQALEYLHSEQAHFPIVLKADGLALGKGVLICQNLAEACEGVRTIMQDKAFGSAGNQMVVEEFLQGPEVSVLAFTDGETLVPMVSSMDHKRALDNDQGLNTGGMGTVAPNPYYTEQAAKTCMETIFLPTIRAMKAEGRPFRGCLYFGLMLTADGPKVIEYNCRFGDPETQVVLPLLKSDLFEIMLAVSEGRLSSVPVEFSTDSAACVVVASGGYPKKYATGCAISGLDENGQLPKKQVQVYHAGTRREDGGFVTAGGRVLGVTATAPTLEQALQLAYDGAGSVQFEGAYKRTDIGRRALAALAD